MPFKRRIQLDFHSRATQHPYADTHLPYGPPRTATYARPLRPHTEPRSTHGPIPIRGSPRTPRTATYARPNTHTRARIYSTARYAQPHTHTPIRGHVPTYVPPHAGHALRTGTHPYATTLYACRPPYAVRAMHDQRVSLPSSGAVSPHHTFSVKTPWRLLAVIAAPDTLKILTLQKVICYAEIRLRSDGQIAACARLDSQHSHPAKRLPPPGSASIPLLYVSQAARTRMLSYSQLSDMSIFILKLAIT